MNLTEGDKQFIAIYSACLTSIAQTISENFLDINNIKAQINADGSFGTNSFGAIEAPKGSGKNTIARGSLWFGGYDAGGQLKCAAKTYYSAGTDFFPGPIDTAGVYGANYDLIFNRVWKINKCDIDIYSDWINQGMTGINPVNDTAMDVINTWPAFNMYGEPLAPFYDKYSDGVYDPSDGDVPLIKGDQAIFFVYNDARGPHTATGTPSIGIEIQGMAYAYSCSSDSALYNTVFTNYKIINKSQFRLDSAFIGNWTDMEIGWYSDDYMGCDVEKGAYYGYNGTAVDGTGQPFAYGINPPAQAVVFLQGPYADPDGLDNVGWLTVPHSYQNYSNGIVDDERLGMSGFLSYNNSVAQVNDNPGPGDDYYQYLAETWKNGTHVTYGNEGTSGSINCKYMFPGNSDSIAFGTNGVIVPSWDDVVVSDVRGLGTYGPFTMLPGSVQTVDFAYVYARAAGGGNLASLTYMQNRIDSIRQKFNYNLNGIPSCGCGGSNEINNLVENNHFAIYPNPACNLISINYSSSSKKYNVKIYDARGWIVKSVLSETASTYHINISDLANGIYLVCVQDGNIFKTKRFIKN